MLGDGEVRGDEVVVAHRDVPADLERPRDDRLAEMGRRRAEARGGDREPGLERLAREEAGRHRGLEERLLGEEGPVRLHPVVGARRVALRVLVRLRATLLPEPEAHEPEVRLPAVHPLDRAEADDAGDHVADARGPVEDELRLDRAVARADELLGRDVVERVAPLGPCEARAVDGVEGLGSGAVLRAEHAADGERVRHLCTSGLPALLRAPRRSMTHRRGRVPPRPSPRSLTSVALRAPMWRGRCDRRRIDTSPASPRRPARVGPAHALPNGHSGRCHRAPATGRVARSRRACLSHSRRLEGTTRVSPCGPRPPWRTQPTG